MDLQYKIIKNKHYTLSLVLTYLHKYIKKIEKSVFYRVHYAISIKIVIGRRAICFKFFLE